MIHPPAIHIADIHVLDEAQDMPALLKEARQINQRVLIDAALHDRIDLQGRISGSFRRVNPRQHLVHARAPAIHLAEYLVIKRIQADCQTLQTGSFQGVDLLWEQKSVGGHRQIAHALQRIEHRHQLLDVLTQERLPASQANLHRAQPNDDARQPRNFFKGQQMRLGQEPIAFIEDLGRHAIGTAEVAAVGH